MSFVPDTHLEIGYWPSAFAKAMADRLDIQVSFDAVPAIALAKAGSKLNAVPAVALAKVGSTFDVQSFWKF